jgi:hypothetical protein
MGEERRKHDRLAQPFEGSWRGASGASACRIGDFSLGGCFVQSLATPMQGEATVVTVAFGDHVLSFSGKVVYIEPGMGFAVQFTQVPENELRDLTRLLGAMGA